MKWNATVVVWKINDFEFQHELQAKLAELSAEDWIVHTITQNPVQVGGMPAMLIVSSKDVEDKKLK